jgi:outer membrane protein assembly factor BamB
MRVRCTNSVGLRFFVEFKGSATSRFLQVSKEEPPETMKTICTTLIISIAVPVIAGQWPGWRGPAGTGITSEKDLPMKWSTSENVRWRTELPERGNSSPIVWGDKVFVTQAVSDSKRRTVMCFDRTNGKLLWQSGPAYTENEPSQQANTYCAATPVTDGERVIASFGSAGLYCYDFDGKELWHRDLGKMQHMFGNASSPVLAGELCILNFGPDEKARLVAVNKKTGETAWEAQPPKVEITDSPREGFGRGGDQAGGPGGERAEGDRRGGDRGGRGGFGPGQMLASQILSQADKNTDQKVSKDEFSTLAADWFGKLDSAQAGKIDQQAFGERFGDLLAPQADAGQDDRQRPGGRRGGFGRFVGPGFFTASDADKDGSLTRDEWTGTFAKWFTEWDKDKAGVLDEAKLREGLNAALPRPQFGQGGPPGGGGGFGRGGGGGGGMRGGPGGGASWSTPVLVSAAGHDELVVSLPGCLAAYDPKTGKQLWLSKGLGGTIYTSPVSGEGALVGMTSGPGGGSAIAVKAGGSGDVSESQRLWRKERIKSGIGSGVIHEGYLYTISQEGIAACMDLKDGNTVWEERLKGPGSRGSSWSSMLLSDGKIYVPNQSGDVFVLRAAPKFEVLATNSVNESTNASLAASDGDLFLRTDKALWCIGKAK